MNYTIKPVTGSDHQRILDWAKRQFVMLESTDGNIVFGFDKNSLNATTTYAMLKRIANFEVL